MPKLVFDRPQWKLVPDTQGARMYANVDNRVEVCVEDDFWFVVVAVPTGIFTLMRDVFKVHREELIRLSIDQDGERYVFSMTRGDHDLIDLWDYSEGSIPRWIFSKEYRL
jgi:hypothetical protein